MGGHRADHLTFEVEMKKATVVSTRHGAAVPKGARDVCASTRDAIPPRHWQIVSWWSAYRGSFRPAEREPRTAAAQRSRGVHSVYPMDDF